MAVNKGKRTRLSSTRKNKSGGTTTTTRSGKTTSRNSNNKVTSRTKGSSSSSGGKALAKIAPIELPKKKAAPAKINPFEQTFQATKGGLPEQQNPFENTFQETKGDKPNPFEATFQSTKSGVSSSGGIMNTLKNIDTQFGELAGGKAGLASAAFKTATGMINYATTATAVDKLGKVGTVSTNWYSGATSTAETIAVNEITKAATKSMLGKIAAGVGIATGVVSGLMGAIGSYPFAGFIKEEALQTLGFATNMAINSGNVEEAENAIAMTDEVLNPNMWKDIFQKVPYANVVSSLQDFYEAANLGNTVNKKRVEDLRIQVETGETEDAKWARLRQEQDEEEKQMIDYYNVERQKQVEWEKQASLEGRNEDARFWADQKAKQMELEAADRKAIADFWEAYRKKSQKAADENRPSKLNFGII